MQLLIEVIKTHNQAALEIAHCDLINWICEERASERTVHAPVKPKPALAMILSSTNVCFSVPLPHDDRSRYPGLT